MKDTHRIKPFEVTGKMNFIIKQLRKLFANLDDKDYIEIGRNESCYCKSSKKFKHCHLSQLEKKGKIALYEIDRKTGERRIKIYSERKYKGITTRFRTMLRGVDVKATDIALNDYIDKPF